MMNIREVIAVVIFSFLFASIANAASTGSSVSERWGNASIAIEYNKVFDRDMDPGSDNLFDMELSESDQIYGVITYTLKSTADKQFNLYVKLGIADLETGGTKLSTREKELHNYEEDEFLWGIGLNYVYSFKENYDIIIDGQYVYWHPEIEEISLGGVRNTTFLDYQEANVSEWQLAILAQTYLDYGLTDDHKPVLTLAPYGGIAISWMQIDISNISYDIDNSSTRISSDIDCQNDDFVTIVIGSDLYSSYMDNFRLRLEGRLWAESALSVSGVAEF